MLDSLYGFLDQRQGGERARVLAFPQPINPVVNPSINPSMEGDSMHPTTVIGVPTATTAIAAINCRQCGKVTGPAFGMCGQCIQQTDRQDSTQAALIVLYQAMRQADCIPGLDMLIGAASYLCRTKDLS